MAEEVLLADGLRFTGPASIGAPVLLNGVNLVVAAGEIVDIGGPSGAGKTTLLRALARLLPKASGHLALRGVSAFGIPAGEWRSRVTLLPQKAVLCSGTVRENLLVPWTLKARASLTAPDDHELAAALAGVALGEIALSRDVAMLSVGQAARVALARTVLTRPDVLLLDEPDAALDDESAARVAETASRFAALGGAVVRVRHQRTEAFATRRLRLADGHLTEVGT
ncbi:MAG: ATP-binding cassette domain-containing protein [Clostridiales bacterium]|nr:ATP-binding cassette domain-containing protein [Clostridiales bacterium]